MQNKILNYFFTKSYGKIFFIIILLPSFTEVNAQSARWKWICYGDTRTNDTAHRSVLQSIMAHSSDFKFMINVGDVTEDGRVTSNWETWQKSCNEILGGTGQDQVPPKYMATPGNHEELLDRGLANWNTYLSGQEKLYGNSGKYFYFDYENARFILMNTEESYTSEQKSMLLNAIETNPKTWLFLIWHKPIFSFGGKPYEGQIEKEWGVPLYQYGCDVIFNGHAHIYLRTKKLNMNGQKYPPFDPVNGIANVITGNSGAPIELIDQNRDGNAYMIDYAYDVKNPKFYGYTELTVDGDTMYLKHISASGQVMDQATYKANYKVSHLPRFRVNTTVLGKGIVFSTPSDTFYHKGIEVTLKAQGELGWKFDKWSGDLSGTQNPEKIIVDTIKNIKAQFVQIPQGFYELRAETEGEGKLLLDPPGPYYAPGTTVSVKAVADTLSKFDRWDDPLLGLVQTLSITMDSHKSIKAFFRIMQTFSLRFRESVHGSIKFTPDEDEFLENTSVKITAVPEPGWEFYEWTGDKNGKLNPDTLVMSSGKEIRAIFKKTGGTLFTLKPVDDTYVRGGLIYSDKNFNADTLLRVLEGSSDSYRCRSFLKYNLKGVQGGILSAILKIRVKSNGLPDGTPAMTNVFSVANDSWQENTLKWKTATQTGSELDSYTVINQPEMTYSWDVTEKIKQETAADSIISFMIKDNEALNKTIDFYSKETSGSPEMIIITDKVSGVTKEEKQIPKEYSLEQNYPNPFNPVTEIKYSLSKPGKIKLKIYDIMGKEVAVLVDGFLPAGVYKAVWEAKGKMGNALSSGIYICSIETAEFSKSIKMILLQ